MIIDPATLHRRDVYKLLISTIIPRPIALVSTVSVEGILNAAPFSFFNGCSSDPPLVLLSIGRRRGEKKDTIKNIEDTNQFVVNMVDEALAEAMNECSGDYPSHIDEFEIAGLTPEYCQKINGYRIKESPVSLECEVYQTISLGDLVWINIVRYIKFLKCAARHPRIKPKLSDSFLLRLENLCCNACFKVFLHTVSTDTRMSKNCSNCAICLGFLRLVTKGIAQLR